MESFSTLEIIGTFIGILYIIFEYRASMWLWPVSVIMPIIYISIYYQAGIYADMGINVYYFLAAIYGWVVWSRGKSRRAESGKSSVKEELPIVYTSSEEWYCCTIVFAATFMILSYILIRYTSSTVPYSDGFTTALSVIGMWMLAHKRIEHWIVWIVVDIVSSVLYFSKGLYPTSGLYLLYTIIAVAGYLKWRKIMKSHSPSPSSLEAEV